MRVHLMSRLINGIYFLFNSKKIFIILLSYNTNFTSQIVLPQTLLGQIFDIVLCQVKIGVGKELYLVTFQLEVVSNIANLTWMRPKVETYLNLFQSNNQSEKPTESGFLDWFSWGWTFGTRPPFWKKKKCLILWPNNHGTNDWLISSKLKSFLNYLMEDKI